MAIVQRSKLRWFTSKVWSVLPADILDRLGVKGRDILSRYEMGVRDELYRQGLGDRVAFMFTVAMDMDRFKELTHAHIDAHPTSCSAMYKRHYRMFQRIIMLHAAAPQQCLPLSRITLDKWTGDRTAIFRWKMLQDGWLKPSGWKNHFTLSKHGQELAEKIVNDVERYYSEFFVSQLELKKERSGEDVF